MFLQPITPALPVTVVCGTAHGCTPPLPAHLRGAVLCLGNFDGRHLGHQSLIAAARAIARRHRRPLALMSCEPHPRSFFAPAGHAPFRLATLAQKRMLFPAGLVDYLFEPTFDAAFAGLAPDEFLHSILLGRLQIGGIACGSDFRFGAGRRGDAGTIAAFCRRHGLFACTVEKTVPASSSGIRQALAERDFAGVKRLLGRDWQIDLQATGLQIRPPAGRYLARSLAHGNAVDVLVGADGTCDADPLRCGRFLDILAAQ